MRFIPQTTTISFLDQDRWIAPKEIIRLDCIPDNLTPETAQETIVLPYLYVNVMLCPLFLEECAEVKEDKLPTSFVCSTTIEANEALPRFLPHSRAHAHFIKYSTGSWSTGIYYLERAVLPPYMLENHHNSNVTRRMDKDNPEWIDVVHRPHSSLFVLGPNPRYRVGNNDTSEKAFIYTLRSPLIHMDIEEKLRQRLKLILLLS